jgi:chromosome segregation ATPase
MLRLEVAKAQMSMFCDAEADKLREIAAEGLKELDRKYQSTITNSINEVDAEGERALRELDASTARFRRRMEESKAQAEASARDSELLEQSIFEARNERLFFKNLYTPAKAKLPRTAAQTQQLQQELKAIRDVTSDSFSSGYRKLLYGALSIVMTSALWSTASAFTSGNPIRWSKVVIYIAILGAIFMQFWFESSQSSDGQTSGSDADASDAANEK